MRIIGSERIFNASHGEREFNVVERIKKLPAVSPDIILSPECKYDKNGDLTGLMFRSEGAKNAVAYPGLVPDNGCGFCLGSVKGIPENFTGWDGLSRVLIHAGGVYSPERRKIMPDDILDVALRGLSETSGFLSDLKRDETLPVLLKQPFGCFLGHFLEIRKVENSENDEHILIIHSGSQGVHRLLNNIIHDKYGYHSRVYGAELNTNEGADRKIAVQIAMNYAKASRLFAFEIICGCLNSFTGAETTFLSDVFHSYIQYEDSGVLHCRGIQNFDCAFNDISFPRYLLAGTQATSSYLMEPKTKAGSICHGTPEIFYAEPECEKFDPPDTLAWRDTPPDGDARIFESATRDLARSFESQGTAKITARLLPVFNMQKADR